MIAESDIPGALRAILELPGVAGQTRATIELYLEFPYGYSGDERNKDAAMACIQAHWSQLVEVGAV